MRHEHIIMVALDERSLGVLLRDGATVRVTNGIPRDAELIGVNADFTSAPSVRSQRRATSASSS
jgi:hypothetical protein